MLEEIVEESLEFIWTMREKNDENVDSFVKGINLRCNFSKIAGNLSPASVLNNLEKEGYIQIQNNKIIFLKKGEEIGKKIIRRHRLTERLLKDILQMTIDEIEEPACSLEHTITEGLEDSICTLLGHPSICPHGFEIPSGNCCKNVSKVLEPVILPLSDMDAGEEGNITYLVTKSHPRLQRLSTLGLTPGSKIKITQTFPTFVVQVDETQIALEKSIAKDIFVRKTNGQNQRRHRHRRGLF
ncbi:MAG: Iron dependent repressor, metal binding and dimerization domain [Candidatus Methanofastidiosum methylothiophilum]|uniref:Iron dependent repressor, metal binding and dimerization domain n=1 Tax=Candidatus Methanofastidiosum methylothiophilum TaxID=1705564 RepID=A0A150IIR3_9EURY|nr:MAG: Iron dependent repressor, metal binding and dimerization domain [Candidatus Methanofastidiosum methylthiophilus]KYC47003.1 MAG: Iron dependent repressor, metal binding and dimerization domain [Candidatus Methanofastidiosum methylthiophilus]KYC49380.1 MAG: Iron dependent repressor, metal binding and dimerization domain [Candidatus Methanofastidiosum methylthiophilus]